MSSRKVFSVPGADFPEWYPSSPVATAGPFAFTASMSAVDWRTGGLAEAARPRPGLPLSTGHPVKLQVREAYRRLDLALQAAGSSLDRGVSINQWQPTYHGLQEREPAGRDPYALYWEDWRRVAHAYIQGRNEFLLSDRPASCLMPVDRLVGADADIEIQLVSLLAGSGITKSTYAHDIHSPLGGYSIGVEAGPWLFSAGFIATDFTTGLHPNARVPEHIWYGNQVAQETEETLRQIRVAMEAAGGRWENVVKVVLYLTPEGIRNLPAIDEVWAKQWPVDPPARAIVPVSGIGGVKHGNVEIYVIVTRPEHGGDREVIHAPNAFDALGHSVQAVRSGPLLFLSTQLGRTAEGLSPEAAAARRGMPHTRRHIVDQVRRIHDDVAAICEAAGTSIENTVKVDAFLTDMSDLPTFLDAWKEPFTDGYPASGFFEVPPGSHEIPDCDVTVDLVVAMP
ncbi:RidA family protein [Microbispora sp. H13382]|uniref:RidA family protein n=1 Tax=Microbispora sp. H13382 TaxID=2729112 RepID=UPI001600F93E|nr:RidA family protein [Microbispora sp. H13382]